MIYIKKTLERSNKIKEAGYNLIEIWECKWNRSEEYEKMRKQKQLPEIIQPLNPTDAFFGGRTNTIKLRAKADGIRTKIRYIDVCSLYPTVQFYDYYPVGHPIKIYEPKQYNPSWYRLIKCKVLAPRKLYHPVLPVKVKMEHNEKLLFPLCIKCAERRTENIDIVRAKEVL